MRCKSAFTQAIERAIPRLGEERRWGMRVTAGQEAGAAGGRRGVDGTPAGNSLPAATPGGLPPEDRDAQWFMQGSGGLALLSDL